VLVLGSLVVIGIEKVKQSHVGVDTRLKHRSSDVPSGGMSDDTSSLLSSLSGEPVPTTMGKARTDEEMPELMVNGNAQGKAE
jgi:hypothetical protein